MAGINGATGTTDAEEDETEDLIDMTDNMIHGKMKKLMLLSIRGKVHGTLIGE